jgi:uncharacterized protein involved in outer membrane biogenesis
MKFSTILKVLLGLIVLVVGALGVFIATLDVSQFKGQIVAAIEENTGRTVTIDGEMDLALGLTPALVVEGVTVGNADWAQDPDMLSVGRLEAQVEILPLISGEIKVVRLVLVDPVVNLETDAEGRGNWAMGAPDGAAEPAEPAPTAEAAEAEGGGAPPAFQIQEVRLENGALTYRNGMTGETLRVALERVSLAGGGMSDPLTLDIAGAYNDAAFTLAGTVGAPAALAEGAGTPWPLDLTATAGGATVTVTGSIGNPAAASGIDLALTARGERIADLAALAQAVGQSVTVPALGPYSVAFQVQGDMDTLALQGLDASLGALPLLKTTAKGGIANLMAPQGIDIAVMAEGAEIGDLADIAAQMGQSVAIPELGPFKVAATVQGAPDALSVSAIDAGLGSEENFRVTATGAIADALAQSGIALNVSVNAPNPAALADLGATLPVPMTASASVSDISGGYAVQNIQAKLGRSSLSGGIEARLDGPRPAVSGALTAPLLDLNELSGGGTSQGSANAGGATAPAEGGGVGGGGGTAGGPMIPDTPLPLDGLRAADVDMTVAVDQAILPGGAEVAGLNLGLTLNDGALSVSPMQAQVAGGALNGSLSLQPTGNGAASVAVDVTGEGVRLGDLAQTFGNSDAILDGPSTIRVQLQGQGASPHQIAGTLAGSVLLHTVDARMNNQAVNWAGGDVFAQLGDLINPFGEKEPTTPIQCLVFNMTATQGVLSNDHGIAMETDRMVVGGGGAFDLGAERLNVKIAPRPRPGIGLETGLGRIVELFAVTGPFASPSLELDAEKALETGMRTAASVAGAVATGGLSLLGESLLVSEDGEMEPCLVALGQKEPGQVTETAPAEGTSGSPVDEVQRQIEGLTGDDPAGQIGGAIEGLLGGGGGGGGGGETAPADGGTQPTEQEQPSSGGGGLGGALQEGIGGLLGN